MSKRHSKELKRIFPQVIRTLDKIDKLLKESVNEENFTKKVHKKFFDALEQHWEFTRKDVGYQGSSPVNYYKFNWINAAKEVAHEFSKEPPSHHLISSKRDGSGLIAFYTNSLCELTEKHFARPHYEEIATIANIVLDTYQDSPITGESVRMNYKNLKERLNKDRKILA